MSTTLGIAIERLSKSFGAVQALADIEIQVKAGEFLLAVKHPPRIVPRGLLVRAREGA